MSTVSFPSVEGNHPAFTRTHALPDEAFTEDAIQASDWDALHHEQSIDFGDDAVNADAAIAETVILARYPKADYVSAAREQRRRWCNGAAEFMTVWTVYATVNGRNAHGVDADLDRAVAAVLAKLGELLAA